MIQRNNIEHLYLHVPFCRSICYYCDFCHVVYNNDLCEAWLKVIKQEIINKKINPNLKTIYIGGGTPISLSYHHLKELLEILKPYTNHLEEYTIEINPETLDKDKSLLLKDYSINRCSIGMQTSNNDLLKSLGRNHTKEDVEKAISLLKEVGIDNISLDIMYSLPNQSIENLKDTIRYTLALKPKHISLYSLTIEDNTVFSKKNINHLDDEIEADMYELIVKELEANDYHQYEISNFSLEGYESKHNKAYWLYKDFYGIGCGASGKEGKIRYTHTNSIKEYLTSNELDIIELSDKDIIFEAIMMGLRLKEGIDIKEFNNRFNIDIEKVFSKSINKHISNENVVLDEIIRCSNKGLEILNEILVDFLEEIEDE